MFIMLNAIATCRFIIPDNAKKSRLNYFHLKHWVYVYSLDYLHLKRFKSQKILTETFLWKISYKNKKMLYYDDDSIPITKIIVQDVYISILTWN